MKALITLFIIIVILLNANIENKIKSSQKELFYTTKKVKGLNIKLSKLANEIDMLQKELHNIDEKLLKLDKLLKQANDRYKQKLEEYEATKKSIKALTSQEKKLKQKLVLLISNAFSKSLLLSSMNTPTQEDVIKEEILKAIQKSADATLQKVGSQYNETKKALQDKKEKLVKLEKEIKGLLKDREELKNLKLKKSKKLTKLNEKKRRYKIELEKLQKQQASLTKTLQKLKILQQSQKSASASTKMKVKKYGQKSYKRIKTVRYRGAKTIPPLEKFIIIKRYGVYKDPIYNIEIPNENIELKPLVPNAKVRNVLNGKVVLAKWTPHLKNVVIVKHANNLYTIYAYLDKIAPFIKKGRRIKKGYILGRVNSKLIFEVTKNNAHIDPLDLIRVN